AHEAAREIQLLLHPRGKAREARVGLLGEAGHREERVGPTPRLGPGDAVEAREEVERLPHGEDSVARRIPSGDHVDPTPNVQGIADDVEAGDGRPAARGEKERRQDLDERRLPGAVRPQEPEALAALDAEVDPLERDHLPLLAAGAEGACERAGLDGGGRPAAGHLPSSRFSASRPFWSGSSTLVESVRELSRRVVSRRALSARPLAISC